MIFRSIIYIMIICSSAALNAKMYTGVTNTSAIGNLVFTDRDGNSLGSIGPSERIDIHKEKFPVTFVIEKDCNQNPHTIHHSGCYAVDFAIGDYMSNCWNYWGMTVIDVGCFW